MFYDRFVYRFPIIYYSSLVSSNFLKCLVVVQLIVVTWAGKGFKLFRFPNDNRGAKWVQNMRRKDKWSPTGSSRLCEVHCTLYLLLFFILM